VERKLVLSCMEFFADPDRIPDGHFKTLFGMDRVEFDRILSRWRNGIDLDADGWRNSVALDEAARRAGVCSLLHLKGYPYLRDPYAWAEVSEDGVRTLMDGLIPANI
jgi:hypothetical protein